MSLETYTPGHGESAIRFMQRRTLASHGAFASRLFKPGQRILDLGCGPATITLDIARKVAPAGVVIGVDQHGEQWGDAREQAAWEGLPVLLEAMNAYALPLAAASFDGMFSHALFEHLKEPLAVLAQVRRLLKPTGFAALRSPDWGGFILEPCTHEIEAAIQARRELQARNGGDVLAGRKLGGWLREAGFIDVRTTASYEIYDDVAPIVEHLVTQLEADGQARHAEVLRRWGNTPHALFAQAWVESIGTAPI